MGELITCLEARLPELARAVITEYLDDGMTRRQFLQNPDDPTQHEPRWHQFGIVTHNKRAVGSYLDEVPRYLGEWDVADELGVYLERPIDGVPRAELLGVGLLLHDIGKFAVHTSVKKEGAAAFIFGDHERYSGSILRGGLFDFLETEFDVSPSQREYIATCGERHYDLGGVRIAAQKSPTGYTISFTSSDEFRSRVHRLQAERPAMAAEVGLLFLADSLSKTDIRLDGVESDGDVEKQSTDVSRVIRDRGLYPGLIKAVKQLPVNVAVARGYLQTWSD